MKVVTSVLFNVLTTFSFPLSMALSSITIDLSRKHQTKKGENILILTMKQNKLGQSCANKISLQTKNKLFSWLF